MNDTTAQNEHNSQERTARRPIPRSSGGCSARGCASGAKVAIRSYMRKHGDASPLPEAAPDDGEEAS